MGRSFADATADFANRAFQYRQLRNQEDEAGFDRLLKQAELQSKGITITPQETQGPRRFFGLVPGQKQRSFAVSFNPEMNPDYQKRQLETEKLRGDIEDNKRKRDMDKTIQDRYFSGQSKPDQASAPQLGPPKEIQMGNYKFPNPDYEKYKQGQELQSRPEMLERAASLRDEFNKSGVYKQFQEIERASMGLEEAYKLATAQDIESRIASDQALGVMFQKMLDPDSVVRESEYARTPEGAALLNRIAAIGPQLVKGGLRLGDQDRLALIEMTRKLYESAGGQFNKHYDRYSNLAQQYAVEPDLIFGGMKRFESKRSKNPDWVPEGFNYEEAKKYYSDDELKRALKIL